jgi:hypothetical protein
MRTPLSGGRPADATSAAAAVRLDHRRGVPARPRRLPINQVIAVGGWILLVISVQPWVRPRRGPQAAVAEGMTTGKGVLLGVVFMVAVALAAPRFRLRMPFFYLAYMVYLFVAAASAFEVEEAGAPLLRALRLGLAIWIPLLLWRWLGGRPALFVRAHRMAHALLVFVVVAGVAFSPGNAWEGGGGSGSRLQGAFIPMLPPRVGEVAAILAGLTILALVFRQVRRVPASLLAVMGVLVLLLSQTRTAAAALVAGLLAAFIFTRRSRQGRRGLHILLLLALLAVPLLGPIQTWVVRDQSAEQFGALTGRAIAWRFIVEQPVSFRTLMIGHGLGNTGVVLRRGEGDINKMGIDSGWLSLYWETGLVGVGIIALAMLIAYITVWRAPTPYIRAATGFLVVYVTVASFTETGLSDLSSQTLHLLVATGAAYADRLLLCGQPLMLPTLAHVRRLSKR